MVSRRHYRKYNHYSDYYNDYEDSPIAGLILLGLFYLAYKYFTDRVTFWHWMLYGIVIIGFLLLIFVIIRIWKRKRL